MYKLSKETVEAMWRDFDVAVNDLEEILESWCGWPVFTDREEIWRWFDEQYAEYGGVHALMYPSERVHVAKCGECPVFTPFRCNRLNMTMYEGDPACDWATLGEWPEDFDFTDEDTRELQEWTKRYQPECWEKRRLQ